MGSCKLQQCPAGKTDVDDPSCTECLSVLPNQDLYGLLLELSDQKCILLQKEVSDHRLDQKLVSWFLRAQDEEEAERIFDCIFYLHTPGMMRYIGWKLSNHPSDVDDIFIEVWEVVFLALIHRKPIKNFNSWLFTITINKINNFYRRHYREKERHMEQKRLFDEQVVGWLEEKSNPFDIVVQAERMARVNEGLRRLETAFPYYFQILQLYFIEELKNQDIAVQIDRTSGAIRVAKSRALKELRKILDELD